MEATAFSNAIRISDPVDFTNSIRQNNYLALIPNNSGSIKYGKNQI